MKNLMKCLPLVIFGLSSVCVANAGDGDRLLGSYTAKISQNDHFSSKGSRLKDAASIIRQDRANFHKFGKRNVEDENDNFFRTAKGRGKITSLFQKGRISKATQKAILNGTPTIIVLIYKSSIDIQIL